MESCTWHQKLQVHSRYIAMVIRFYLNLQSKKNRLLKVSCLPGLLPWESGAVCSVLTAVHSHSLIPSRKCVFSLIDASQSITGEGVSVKTHRHWPLKGLAQLLAFKWAQLNTWHHPVMIKNNCCVLKSSVTLFKEHLHWHLICFFPGERRARQAHREPFFKWLDLFISSRNWEEPAEKYLAVCN